MKNFTIAPVIAVPARNEEEHLPLLLAALAGQSWHAGSNAPLPIIIVLNNCTDGSHNAVLDAIASYPKLAIRLIDIAFDEGNAHVGAARRLAMETAFAACDAPARAAILTTDADAVPHVDWLSANLHHLADGIDLVGGLIIGNKAEEEELGTQFNLRARLHQLYSRTVDRLDSLINPKLYDLWPRHHDHTGASLAIRADVYQAMGGLPALPFREDIALVERVRQAGYRIRHPLDVVVEVSARLVGRAPGGMADCLSTWMREAAAGAPLMVEHPERVVERIFKKEPLSAATISSAKQAMIPAEEAIALLEIMIARFEGNRHAA